MSNVRARKDTAKLFIDFQYFGIRCREQTSLMYTAANRKKVEELLERVEAKVLLGKFNYAEFFPSSPNLRKIEKELAIQEAKE